MSGKALHIHLLGEFRLLYDGKPVLDLYQSRHLALLAYLLLHREGPQPRRRIAFLFWPDVSEWQARGNLRKLLYDLRQVLPDRDQFLQSDAQTLGWRADAPLVLDVAELDTVLEGWQNAETLAPNTIERVLDLYRGELLPTCYDDWILPLRRALHERVVNGLEKAIEGLEAQRAYALAIRCAEHLLRLDPLHENAYQQLMRLLALSGNRASALRVYHECASVLERELGVSPSAPTRAVYERLFNVEPQPVVVSAAPTALADQFPLVGRSVQWAQLQAAWQRAHQQPHMVIIGGEAGSGKSRLALELGRWVRMRTGSVAYSRCYASEGALAYTPLTEWLRSETLSPGLGQLAETWQREVARLLPELLADRTDLLPSMPMTEGWQRQRFHHALVRAVLAAPQPLLLLLDDLQWCDQETLEWLHYLLRTDPQARLLVVGTVRSEEVQEGDFLLKVLRHLRRENLLSEIELDPLSAEETATLARHMIGEVSERQASHLYQETEGNPLFIVETVRMGLVGDLDGEQEEDHRPMLPPTVQSVVAARLAQLSTVAHQLAQVAAVIGRAFNVEVLAGASGSDTDTLVQALDELWQRRIVREGEGDRYDFSHDKIREVAYSQVSRARRRVLHHQVAETLARVHAQDLDAVCGQLAVHYEQARAIVQAVYFYRQAGEVARRISAYEDAIGLFTRGLKLLQLLPESAQRDAKEIDLQTALGVPLVFARGYDAPGVRQTYLRALALTQGLNLLPGAPVLRGLALTYMAVGAVREVHTLGGQLLQLSHQEDDHALSVEAHYLLGATSFWIGDFAASRTHLEEAVVRYDPSWHRRNTELYSHDSGAICLVRLGLTLWVLGYPEQAAAHSRAALALAQAQNHSLTLAYVHSYSAWICRLRGDLTGATTENEALLALCHKLGLPFWSPTGWNVRGELLVSQGEIEAGLDQIQRGLAGFETESQNLHRPYIFALVAHAYGAAGKVDQGLALVQAGMAATEKTEEHFWDAELHRLRGTLLLARDVGRTDEVETEFQQALTVARNQGTKSLELRAALSLARLWQAQGKVQTARALLEPLYGWFNEGFNTADLRDARALLETLG